MTTEAWHTEFNPKKFLGRVSLDQLLERNQAYNESSIDDAKSPCILCARTIGQGILQLQSAYDTALADWETKQTEYNNLVVKANTESTAEQTAVSKFNQANAKAENSSTAQKLVEAQKVAAEKNVVTFTKYANAAAASASALETEASSAAKDAARDKP